MPVEIVWLLKAGLWVIFLVTLSRAYKNNKLTDVSARRMWLMFFLWNIAFTLWDESGEVLIDQFFNGLPVGLFVKSACMALTFHAYYLMLKPMEPNMPRYRWLDRLAPIMLAVGFTSFILYSVFQPIPDTDLRFLVVAVRDLTMLVYVLSIFIPFTWVMWKNEHNWSLKFKQFAALTCFTCYSLVALSGIGAGVVALVGSTIHAEAVASSTDPAVYIGFIAFMITLIAVPLALFAISFGAFVYLLSTSALENVITGVASITSTSTIVLAQLTNPNELELVVYRTLISILDHYHVTQSIPTSVHLYEQIQAVVSQNQDYSALVKGLTRVRA